MAAKVSAKLSLDQWDSERIRQAAQTLKPWFSLKDKGDGFGISPAPDQQAKRTWLTEAIWPFRGAYKQAIILAFAINFLGLFAAIFSLQVYDRVVAHGGLSTLTALVIGMVIIIAMDYAFRSGRALLLQRIGARIEVGIARETFKRMMNLPAQVLEQRPPGYWQSVYRDVEVVRSTFSGATAMMLVDLPFLVLSLILIAIIATPLLPLSLLTIFAFVLLAWRSGHATQHAHENEREMLVHRDVLISELAGARMHLKSMGAADPAMQRWDASYAAWLNESIARSRESDHYRELGHSMTMINTVLVTSVGALIILNQNLTLGGLIAANILSGRMLAPLVQLVSQWRLFGQFRSAKRRLDELFAAEVDRTEMPVDLAVPRGILRLENVSFSYPGVETPQLGPISGEIGPLGLHAVVGPNGSGKTTLIKTLRGLYKPSEGRLLLDGADMLQYSQAALVRHIGYLPQETQLLSGTVAENLRLANPNATDEQLITAAKQALAHDFIVDLPDGYDTKLGDGARKFSIGQAKRIMIAQTLLNTPQILLLDEPTAELDREAEVGLVNILRELSRTKTIVVASHSTHLLSHCQGILVLNKGKLVAAGPAASLLPKLGIQPAVVAEAIPLQKRAS